MSQVLVIVNFIPTIQGYAFPILLEGPDDLINGLFRGTSEVPGYTQGLFQKQNNYFFLPLTYNA